MLFVQKRFTCSLLPEISNLESVLSTQKSLKMDEKNELIYTLMQPTRRKMLLLLLKSKEAYYIKEIADKVDASPRNTSFHLSKLAAEELVDWEFKPIESESGRAGKYYSINPKFIAKLTNLLEIKI